MNENRIVTEMKLVKGPVKKVSGVAQGDMKLQSDGGIDKGEGKTRNVIGDVKDPLKK